jgi:class 3 adenylate cyclase
VCVGGRSETRTIPQLIDLLQRYQFPSAEMPDENQHPTSQRKNATVLFADLSGFTAMSANLDPEEVRDIVNRYFEALSTAVRRYEGSIDKYIGDCVMAVFGVPATHENDAERACRAALDMRLAVRDLALWH